MLLPPVKEPPKVEIETGIHVKLNVIYFEPTNPDEIVYTEPDRVLEKFDSTKLGFTIIQTLDMPLSCSISRILVSIINHKKRFVKQA